MAAGSREREFPAIVCWSVVRVGKGSGKRGLDNLLLVTSHPTGPRN